jgi:hypothetical protein
MNISPSYHPEFNYSALFGATIENAISSTNQDYVCVDGSQQLQGGDMWTLVISWSTVQLIILLSTILGLKS